MMLSLRPFADDDVQALLPLADAAVPFDNDGNQHWVQARLNFDDTAALRRHYVVEDAGHTVVGYGAIEQQDGDPRRFRIYVVPERFGNGIEDMLFARLSQDLGALGAQVVWVREHNTDAKLLAFFGRVGFVKTHFVWDMRLEIPAGDDLVQSPEPMRYQARHIRLTTLERERQARADTTKELYALCHTLLTGTRRGPLTQAALEQWLEQPGLLPDAFVIVSHQQAYVGLHALKRTNRHHELVQEFAGLVDPTLTAESGTALRDWLMAYARQGQYQRIVAYTPADDSDLLALNAAIGYQRIFGYVSMEKRLV